MLYLNDLKLCEKIFSKTVMVFEIMNVFHQIDHPIHVTRLFIII